MRIALAVEYDGSAFCGWQRQPHCHSVQAEVEHALARIAQQPITVHCAGRTDTGVHAYAQIIHFDTSVDRSLQAWTFGVNSHLDRRVAVHWASVVADDFHARHKAINRSYRYSLVNRACRSGLFADRLAWEKRPLDAQRMHAASQVLLGEHDFSSFRSAACQANHAIRELQGIAVSRHGVIVQIEVTANGFLHNMVRIISGCLIRIGTGDRPVEWLADVLEARDRTIAGTTAKPHGLCFVQPRYPEEWGIPDFSDQQALPWRPGP